MASESHKRAIRESLETISESIIKGVVERQRNIGFHCSVAAVDILEVFLHSQNLINPGVVLKHNDFSSVRRVKEKLDFDFKNKDEVISLICELERVRNLLCYGKARERAFVEGYVLIFNKLLKIFDEMGVKYE